MFQPTIVLKVAQLAKLYEFVATSASPPKQFLKFSKNSVVIKPLLSLSSSNKGDFPSTKNQNQLHQQPYRSLTPAFMSERRSKGLCYFYDEPFTPTHSLTHKNLEIHVLEVNDRPSDLEDLSQNFLTNHGQSLDPHISINALTGVAKFKTMRVTSYFKKRPIHILIGSGSTYNFLDALLATKMGCLLEENPPLNVVVADGAKVTIMSMVKQLSRTIQGIGFTSDMLLLSCGCCDLVLGIEWFLTLGDITWNFEKLTMLFSVKGRKFVLRGSSRKFVLRGSSKEGLKTMRRKHICDAQDVTLLHSLTTHASPSVEIAQIVELFLQISFRSQPFCYQTELGMIIAFPYSMKQFQ